MIIGLNLEMSKNLNKYLLSILSNKMNTISPYGLYKNNKAITNEENIKEGFYRMQNNGIPSIRYYG